MAMSRNDPHPGALRAPAGNFSSIVAARWSRRDFVAAGIASVFAVPDTALSAGQFQTGIEPTRADRLVVAAGLRHDVLLRFGDALWPDDPGQQPRERLTRNWLDVHAAKRQSRRFGDNCDAVVYFPLNGSSADGLLCVNHEYVIEDLLFASFAAEARRNPTGRRDWMTRHPHAVPWMQAAHGVSVTRISRAGGRWQHVKGGRYARRITANTSCQISGPARGSELLRTRADPAGERVLGTFGNCAGGKTPWGTYLTAEESIDDYFGGARSWSNTAPDPLTLRAHSRLPLPERSAYGWELTDPRFDLRHEPNEPLRHGWIVEIDPHSPQQAPRKRTALGRFMHEGANTILTRSGQVAVYMGDDTKFEYAYKFVSRDRFDPKHRERNFELLDHGTLYVARFDASGRGVWLPLVHDEKGALNSRVGFRDQADVVIKCRAAADILGATPMDRTEDVEPNPLTGRVYIACTMNSDRSNESRSVPASGRVVDAACDSANPRPQNDFGHIIELIEAGDDAASQAFSWNVFLLAGDPRNPGTRFLTRYEDLQPGSLTRETTYFAGADARERVSPIACPDNLGFDPAGRLWIASDADSKLIANNGCFVVPTAGPDRGLLRQVVSGPVGCEICACEFTPDGRTLFLSVQHPGEGGSIDQPVSHWPDGGDSLPRSAVVAISRDNGEPL
jgi:secreted PhoX family phosphatase